MTTATIRVPALKVKVPLAADALPRDLVPSDGPRESRSSTWSWRAAR